MSSNYRNLSRTGDTGIYTVITVGVIPVELKVGVTALKNRDSLILQPKGNGIFYAFDNLVTPLTGIKLFKDQMIALDVTDSISIYAVTASGTVDIVVQEVA